MIDVDLCVVGAGFAGLMAALRLEQGAAGRAVERQKAAKWAPDNGGAVVGPQRAVQARA